MPIDEITWVLRSSLLIQGSAETFSETDGARVLPRLTPNPKYDVEMFAKMQSDLLAACTPLLWTKL